MSVPVMWPSEEIPVGMHLAGRSFYEPLPIKLATQLEQAAPWRKRYICLSRRSPFLVNLDTNCRSLCKRRRSASYTAYHLALLRRQVSQTVSPDLWVEAHAAI